MTAEYPDFSGFDWDDGNREKNLKHDVHGWECEQTFFNKPLVILDDTKHAVAESRYAAFGQTDAGRRLVIVHAQGACTGDIRQGYEQEGAKIL